MTGSGTGFYFDYLSADGRVMPLVVTNRHVVEGEWGNSFRVHISVINDGKPMPSGVCEDVVINNIQNEWVFHPDPLVDLAILPFVPVERPLTKRGLSVYRQALTQSLIPSAEVLSSLLPNEEITMVGYPTSLWDEINNYPLFRRGITATHPAINFMGKKEFLIDMAAYHGSSGSPVVVCNQSFFPTKDGSLKAGNRLLFLGVLHAGAVRRTKGKIVQAPVPTSVNDELVFEQMVHIGYVIQASQLLELIEAFVARVSSKAVT